MRGRGSWIAIAVIAGAGGCGADEPPGENRANGPREPAAKPAQTAEPVNATPARQLLLVSGRDEHGELAGPRVPLRASPAGRVTGHVVDGTLVARLSSHGDWHRVRTLEGPARAGWVEDVRVRAMLHLKPRGSACRIRARSRPGGEAAARSFAANELVVPLASASHRGKVWLQVRARRGGAVAWVQRAAAAELPDRGVAARCG